MKLCVPTHAHTHLVTMLTASPLTLRLSHTHTHTLYLNVVHHNSKADEWVISVLLPSRDMWLKGEQCYFSCGETVRGGGGCLLGLTTERGLLLWPRPLLLTQGADSKPWVYGSSECGGSLMWELLCHIYRSRLDSGGTICIWSSVHTDLGHLNLGQWWKVTKRYRDTI